jgi:hypothetical protein
MRLLIAIAGLLLFPAAASAWTPVSKHVEQRLNDLTAYAGTATTGSPLSPCPDAALERRVITGLRDTFRNVELSLREGGLDIAERSACAAYDIALIEEEIAAWIRELITYTIACEESAANTLLTVVGEAADLLLDVREGGLDPDERRPEVKPPTATADDAKETCPYASNYAVPTFQDFFTEISPQEGKGCQLGVFPSSGPPGFGVLEEEVNTLDRIVRRFVSLSPTATGVQESFFASARKWRGALNALKNATWEYLTKPAAPHFLRAPGKPAGYPFPLPPANLFPTYGDALYTVGEAGCRGWPSILTHTSELSISETVLGEGFPLARRGFSPFAVSGDPFLTQDLLRAATFLKEVISLSPNEYLIMLRREIGGSFPLMEVLSREATDLFYEHMRKEAALQLSVGEFQGAMRGASSNLLRSSRELARLSVTLPDDPPPGDYLYRSPLLRDVLRKLVTFMSQMCPNRGCSAPLERSFELSLREECFPFTMINQYGTGAHAIPHCGAKYTPP